MVKGIMNFNKIIIITARPPLFDALYRTGNKVLINVGLSTIIKRMWAQKISCAGHFDRSLLIYSYYMQNNHHIFYLRDCSVPCCFSTKISRSKRKVKRLLRNQFKSRAQNRRDISTTLLLPRLLENNAWNKSLALCASFFSTNKRRSLYRKGQ